MTRAAVLVAALLLVGCGASTCLRGNWSEDGVEWEGVTLTAGPEAASYCGDGLAYPEGDTP